MTATDGRGRPPSRAGRVAIALLLGLLVGGGMTAVVQQRTIDVLEGDLAEATEAGETTQGALATAETDRTALAEQNSVLQVRLDAATKQLRAAARRLDEQDAPQAPLNIETAEHLPGGMYFGRIVFVQSPSQISVDLEQVFTGTQAQREAEKDGAIPPGQQLPTSYYVRNEAAVARVVQVVNRADVRILVDGTSARSKTVTMDEFARMYSDIAERFNYLRTGYYDLWFRRERIVKIAQRYLPPA